MSDSIDGFVRETEQDARRRSVVQAKRDVRITFKLRRSDPRVQQFLHTMEVVAAELDTTLILPETTKIGAVMRLLDALRACGVPVDEVLADAGYANKTGDQSVIMRAGIELVGAFGSLLGGRARDAADVLQERLQEKVEAKK